MAGKDEKEKGVVHHQTLEVNYCRGKIFNADSFNDKIAILDLKTPR